MQLAKIGRDESIAEFSSRIKSLVSGATAAIKSRYRGATELDQRAKMDLINDSALGAFVMGLRGNLEISLFSI